MNPDVKILPNYEPLNRLMKEKNWTWDVFLLSCYFVVLSITFESRNQKICAILPDENHQLIESVSVSLLPGDTLVQIVEHIKQTLQYPSRTEISEMSYFVYSDSMEANKTLLPGGTGLAVGNDGHKICFQITDESHPDLIHLLEQRFLNVCKAFLDDAHQKLNQEIVLGAEERREIIRMAAGDKVFNKDTTFHAVFEHIASQFPNRIAVTCGDEEITYEQLNQKANQVARYLHEHVSGTENLIGIYLERSVSYMIAILGIIKSGNGYVPLDPDTLNPGQSDKIPEKRFQFMLQDTGTPLVITSQHYRSVVQKLSKGMCAILNLDEEAVLRSYSSQNLDLPLSSTHVMYGIYTSGSTGHPKLTVIEHHSVMNLFHNLDRHVFSVLEEGQIQRCSVNAPFGFDVSVQQLTGLLKGYCITIFTQQERNSASGLIQAILRHKITILDCTPSHFMLMQENGLLNKCTNVLQAILIGGEALPQKIWDVLRTEKNIHAFHVYGPTECTVDCTIYPISLSNEPNPILGRPMDNFSIFVLDDMLRLVPIGCEGELYVAGEGVARGYYRRPDMNTALFIENPDIEPQIDRLYKTGDRGRYMHNGNLQFIGRTDSQIKIRSHRIELTEVSSILNQHPNVKDSLIVVRTVQTYESLIAYLILKKEDLYDAAELSEYLGQFLPGYMIPNYFVALDEWPLNANRKIDRSALPLPHKADSLCLEQEQKNIFMDQLEQKIARIMIEVLKIDEIKPFDNFMSLGGDSLRVMTLLAKILDQFGVEIDFAEFFQEPTLAMIKRKLEREEVKLTDEC